MPWVKLDDGFLTNPKVMRAGLEGRALYIAGLCYCAGGLTDGLIPREALAKLGSLADVRKPAAAAAQLVAAGLWEPVDGGYLVHDYLKYQPSAEGVRKERDRVADWRAKRSTERVRGGVQNGVPNADPDVYGTAPRPVLRGPGPARPELNPQDEKNPPNPPLAKGGRRRRRATSGVEFDTGDDAPKFVQRPGPNGKREWVEVPSSE